MVLITLYGIASVIPDGEEYIAVNRQLNRISNIYLIFLPCNEDCRNKVTFFANVYLHSVYTHWGSICVRGHEMNPKNTTYADLEYP